MNEITKAVIDKIIVPVCLLVPPIVLVLKSYQNTITLNDFLIGIVLLLFGIFAKLLTFDNIVS